MPSSTVKSDDRRMVSALIEALRGVRSGQPEPSPSQLAVIELHKQLKEALRGPSLVAAGPVISGFNPTTQVVGQPITITGERLRDATLVGVGAGRTGEISDRAETSITVVVPAEATTGKVTVFTPLGFATSEGTFTVG